MQLNPTRNAIYALRRMTPEQLLYFGTSQMVYLKVGTYDGEQAYVIYGADGMPLEAVGAIEDVWDRIAERGLSLVTVH
jgi:hypothetical protein